MDFPQEGVLVSVQHPLTKDWELGYYAHGNWWRGVDDALADEVMDYVPLEWRIT
jgi:hypothetical protein